MKILALGLALFLVSMSSHAVTVEHRDGRVVYSGSCESKRIFSYFDGARLQKPCIGATEAVSVRQFIHMSIASLCRKQVRVNHGTVENGVLYATDIEEGMNCSSNDGGIDLP